jgi:hypothetical protein
MIVSKWILLLSLLSSCMPQVVFAVTAVTTDSSSIVLPQTTPRVQCTHYQFNSITTNNTPQISSAPYDPSRCITLPQPFGGSVTIIAGNVSNDTLYNICFFPFFSYLHQSTEVWIIGAGIMNGSLTYTCCMAPANTVSASSAWENASGGGCA